VAEDGRKVAEDGRKVAEDGRKRYGAVTLDALN